MQLAQRTRAARCGLACLATIATIAGLLAGCSGDDGFDPDHENEIISRVELSFTPAGGGPELVFAFSDPDGDGGVSGMAEPVVLAAQTTYTLAIRFQNGLVDPPADISEEVAAEAEDHLVMVLGSVDGPASNDAMALLTHDYADLESDYGDNAVGEDLPLGLRNTISATTAGSGQLRVILRHLPALNGEAQKTAELPAQQAAGVALPGAVDVDVVFELVVQ